MKYKLIYKYAFVLCFLVTTIIILLFFEPKLNGANLYLEKQIESNILDSKVFPKEHEFEGFLYSQEGDFIGKIGNQDRIFITTRETYNAIINHDSIYASEIYSLTEISGLSHSEFIDRVNWTYGEGGGMAAEFYASTINNMANKMGEEKMYIQMNEGEKNTTPQKNKEKYFVKYKGSNKNYSRFIKYRGHITQNNTLSKDLKRHLKYLKKATQANIDVLTGKISDLTLGATNKIGGKSSIKYALKHNTSENPIIVVKAVNKETQYTSYHIFFCLGNLKQKMDEKYILITMEDFNTISKENVLFDS